MLMDVQLDVLVWQFAQRLVVIGCVGGRPVAVVPLWQLAQLPVTLEWLNEAGLHAVVVWQVLHSADVAKCVAGLPVALVPL